MKIVIAPDSFKESVSAAVAAQALSRGLRAVLDDVVCECVPLADGGEGTVDALVAATSGSFAQATVSGPLGTALTARYGLLGDGHTVVLEMAAASGLALVPANQRDAGATTSYGMGELLRAALNHHPQRIIVGLGGSATNDGGAGMCQALGVCFLDADARPITTQLCGNDLLRIAAIDCSMLDARLHDIDIEIASDVDNPLLGERGASAVFAPQKGANEASVARLDAALAHFYTLVERSLGIDVSERPGAGAAGGLGAAMLAFLGARMRPGIDIVIEASRLRERLVDADLVITGEGLLDAQTLHGKTAFGVARLCAELGLPIIAVGGGIDDNIEACLAPHFDAIAASVCRPMPLADALAQAEDHLVRSGMRIAYWIKLGQRLSAARA